MQRKIIPIILSGGAGTRLWPLSTTELPKQFIPLTSDKSLLQETILRLENATEEITQPIIVTNKEYRSLVSGQLQVIKKTVKAIILEPIRRNTAPAIAIATMFAQKNENDPILLVLPADHAIKNLQKFHQAINLGKIYAESGGLVTFGIKPTRPETGYGYIKFSGDKIEKFVEKPDLATAQQYIDSGQFYWNSGMFMFRASVFLQELKKLAPEIFANCEATVTNIISDGIFVSLPEKEFTECPSDSIDYAVMEKTNLGYVVPLDAEWSDIGSWKVLLEYNKQTTIGNSRQ